MRFRTYPTGYRPVDRISGSTREREREIELVRMPDGNGEVGGAFSNDF